jgi:hypothetical protein
MLHEIHVLQDDVTSSPYSHDVVELAIAVAASFRISHRALSSPVWLLHVGVPSSDKTNTIRILKGAKDVLFVDTFTENALASGFYDPENKVKRADLLSRIQYGCVVFKELTTLFSMRDERVRKVLGEFQSIFDGEFIKPSGVGEGVAWEGHISVLGCITEQSVAQHYKYMGRIGSRFLFYRLPKQTAKEHKEGFEKDRERRVEVLKVLPGKVAELIHAALTAPLAFEKGDETPLQELAEFLALGRAAAYWRRGYHDEYELEDLQVEEPYRILEQLRTLGQALALIHGRNGITAHEVALLKRVVFSTVQPDRAAVMHALLGGPLKIDAILGVVRKSEGKVRQVLNELERLELVKKEEGASTGGRKAYVYHLEDCYRSLIPAETIDHKADLARV